MTMADINTTFFFSLIIICIGVVFRKAKIMTQKDGAMLTKIVFNITLPATIIMNLSQVKLDATLAMMPVIALSYATFIGLSCLLFFKKYPPEKKGLMIMACLGFNVVNFAYPIITGIWGTVGFQYIAMYDIGNSIIIFGIVYVIAIQYSPSDLLSESDSIRNSKGKIILKRLSKSMPLISYAIALFLNFLGIIIPSFLNDLLTIISGANSFIIFFILGLFLNFQFEKSQWTMIGKILLFRYGFGLIIGLSLFFLLPFVLLARTIICIALVLPTGLITIFYASELKYDEKLIGTIVSLTIIISFILVWILIIILTYIG
jgi:hypothetical protein